jgi:hypothetical protein
VTSDMRSATAVSATSAREGEPPATTRPAADRVNGIPQWLAMGGMATVGMTAVRIAGWTASDLLFLAASLVIVLRLLTGTRRNLAPVIARRSSPGILVGLVLISAGGLIATFARSFDPAGSALALARVWYITVVWFWTIRSATTSVRTYRRLLLAAIVGAVVHAFVGIVQDVTGANAGAPGWGRSTGWSDHFGDLAISVGSMIPIVTVWRQEGQRRRRGDVLRVIALLVLIGGLASSGSISPVGAVIVGTMIAVFVPRLAAPGVRRRRRLAVPIILAIAVIGVLATGSLDLSVQTRFTELTTGSNAAVTASAESRAVQTQIATADIIGSPVVGVGLDVRSGMVEHDGERNSVHNFYMRLLYEAGILALLGLLLILVLMGHQAWQLVIVTRNTTLIWLPSALLGCFVMVLVSAFFGPVLYGRISWLPMGLISGLYGIARAGGLNAGSSGSTSAPLPSR